MESNYIVWRWLKKKEEKIHRLHFPSDIFQYRPHSTIGFDKCNECNLYNTSLHQRHKSIRLLANFRWLGDDVQNSKTTRIIVFKLDFFFKKNTLKFSIFVRWINITTHAWKMINIRRLLRISFIQKETNNVCILKWSEFDNYIRLYIRHVLILKRQWSTIDRYLCLS